MRNEELTNSYRKGYVRGLEDGKSAGMVDGRNEIWEILQKITEDERNGGYPIKMLNELFGSTLVYNIVHDYTPQEVMDKIKEYEVDHDSEIKVGDEITSYTDTTSLVIGIGAWGEWHCITAYGTGFEITKEKQKYWEKTGRHFDAISEVLKQMNREEDK